ncbi:MAG: ribonuclease T2 [Bryobacterales bacterium]|jgi:ribonuclease T2|nr:ribonuclease T2 [Bryobacterales bacterium]
MRIRVCVLARWQGSMGLLLALCITMAGCGGTKTAGSAREDLSVAAASGMGAEAPDQVVTLTEPTGQTVTAVETASTANFDYYVLALSWSPQHCATPAGNRDRTQCAGPRSYGFIVHGLWPQFERGFPQDCGGSAAPSRQLLSRMMDIMPSEGLIRHEWRKHGTCSGLSPEDYFAVTRRAFEAFRTPAGYGTPSTTLNVKPSVYKQALLDANPALGAQHVAVICSGRFLQEVRVCLDKNLNPRPCGGGVRDRCNVPEMIVRPLR